MYVHILLNKNDLNTSLNKFAPRMNKITNEKK